MAGGASRWVPLVLVAAFAALLGGAYLLSGAVQAETGRAASVLSDGDLESVRDYIRSFGVWAPAVSLLLMVFQAVAAPIPSFVVVFANGLAFGIAWGWAISLVGQVQSASGWRAGSGVDPSPPWSGGSGWNPPTAGLTAGEHTPCSSHASCPGWRSIPFPTRPV
jgi:hypothetical protein